METGDFPPKNSSERGTTGAWFEGCLGVLFARRIPPERKKKGGDARVDDGVKMGTKKDPQRFTASPLSGAIIRETSCSS